MVTHDRYFRVTGHDLVYLKFIVEAYEGHATLSTVDKKNGVVVIKYGDCFATPMGALLRALEGEISLVEIDPPPGAIRSFG